MMALFQVFPLLTNLSRQNLNGMQQPPYCMRYIFLAMELRDDKEKASIAVVIEVD